MPKPNNGMSNLLNIGGHGIGDCILSLQISHFLKLKNFNHVNLISTRKEVFDPLNYFFKEDFNLINIDESYAHENSIISSDQLQQELKNQFDGDEITYNVPDLLFRSPLSLDWRRFGLNIQLIKKTRVLSHRFSGEEKIIYCGLCSTTDGYVYKNIPLLLRSLAEFLPDHIVYFPMVKKWNKEINNLGNFDISLPSNVLIHHDPKFEESLHFLKRSCYGIFTCNGPSHLAYQLGIPRLVLDPQYDKAPWISRWKEDYEECIPISTPQNEISELVFHNIRSPETTLIDRKRILSLLKNEFRDWKSILYLKF